MAPHVALARKIGQNPAKSHNSSQDDDAVARVSTCLTCLVISRFPTISFSVDDITVILGCRSQEGRHAESRFFAFLITSNDNVARVMHESKLLFQ